MVLVGIMAISLIAAIIHIYKIQQELAAISEEQHQQNKDVIDLLKYRGESSVIILQHTDVLKYLMDQDPLLNKIKMPAPMSYIVGEA